MLIVYVPVRSSSLVCQCNIWILFLDFHLLMNSTSFFSLPGHSFTVAGSTRLALSTAFYKVSCNPNVNCLHMHSIVFHELLTNSPIRLYFYVWSVIEIEQYLLTDYFFLCINWLWIFQLCFMFLYGLTCFII